MKQEPGRQQPGISGLQAGEDVNIPDAPILVEWEDSRQPRESWEWIDESPTPRCVSCQSVGFVVAETDSALLLAPTLGFEADGDRQMMGAITIAKRQIVKTTCLSSWACPGLGSTPMPPPSLRLWAWLGSLAICQRLMPLWNRSFRFSPCPESSVERGPRPPLKKSTQ